MNDQIDRHSETPKPRRLARRLVRIMVSVALVAALGACSALKLGYNALPDLLYWWLDGYADFDDGQVPRVREALARLAAWHRGAELPKFAEMLGRMEPLVAGTITPAQACGFVAEVRTRLNAVAEEAAPAVVGIGATFNGKQLRHLERKFGRKNAEFRAERVEAAPEERLERRYRQWAERLEMVYGTLEEPQRQILRAALAQSIYDPGRLLTEWQRRQVDLLQVLRQLQDPAVDPAQGRVLLLAWFVRLQHSPDAAYRRYNQALWEEGCRTFAAVHESTTPEQRARAARRLRAYQRDLTEMARAN